METKLCPKCKVEKETTQYQKNKTAKDGLQYHCKSCRSFIDNRETKRAQDRERYHTQKEKYRDQFYKRTYKISLEDYNNLLEKQGGVCAACSTTCVTGRKLAVDHCHSTGRVRGLLCKACNQALGLLKDDPKLIRKLLEYGNT